MMKATKKESNKMIKNCIISLIIVIVMASAAGIGNCETYGTEISNLTITPITEIFGNIQGYEGKVVTVKGVIAVECPTGCWFNIKEGGAMLRVDLKPAGIAIPQKVGQKVVVEGAISVENGSPVLYGTGVKI